MFKRKGNEIQYKFNSKIQDSLDDVKSHLEANAVDKAKASLSEGTSLLTERQTPILLAHKSEFDWKTVEKYSQRELADDEAGGIKKDSTCRGKSRESLEVRGCQEDF